MKFARTATVLTAVITLAVAFPAAASTAPVWQSARRPALPSGAVGISQGYVAGLACPSAGNCVAAGTYDDVSGNTQGLMLNEVGGVWRGPTRLLPPANAAHTVSIRIFAVSCGAVGYCSAVGSFQDQSGNVQSLVDSGVAGVWRPGVEVRLPSNALVGGQYSRVTSVTCTAPGSCSALGTYLDNSAPLAHTEGFTVNQVGGVWRQGVEVRLPPRANFDPSVSLNQVACASPGNCAGVGSYIDADNVTRGLIVNEVRGVWSPGASLVLPGDANAYPNASLSAITGTATGRYTVIGDYVSASGDVEGLAASGFHQKWSPAVPMTMPPGAASNPHTFFYGYSSISCQSVGNCSAGGQFLDVGHHYQGFLINERNGIWQRASRLMLPSGAIQAGPNGGVVAVSCTSPSVCSAGAAYLDQHGEYQALVVSRVGATWRTGVKVTLPSGALSVGVGGGVYGLVCQSNNACTAVGSYFASARATEYEPFTITTK